MIKPILIILLDDDSAPVDMGIPMSIWRSFYRIMTTTRRKKLWLTVKMGRGSIDAMVTASHASNCKSCGREIWWGIRKDDQSRMIPLERRWQTEQGEKKTTWYAHHIFCPVSGVLVKKTGQTPLFDL